jgi:hypothetical protein
MTRGSLELQGFLAEVLVERRQDPDTVVLVVLELKRGRGYVREVRVVKVKECVAEKDREEARTYGYSSASSVNSGGAAALISAAWRRF